MIIRIRTLFPEFYNEFKKTSVIGRAIENKVVDFQTIDLKKYSRKNHRVDGHEWFHPEGLSGWNHS